MVRARNQLYSIPTYDAIFKLVLAQDNIRPSFFHAFLPDLHIQSSTRIDDHMNPLKELQVLRDLFQNEKNNQCCNLLKENSDFSVHVRKNSTVEPCQESTEFIRAIINQFDDLRIAFPKVEYDGTMDFVCKLDTGDNILIEMQIIPYNHWDQRALAYVAALYGRQIRKGGKWDDIKRIIGINILGGGKDQTVHWEDTPDEFVRHYKLTEQLHPNRRIMEGIEIIQYSIMNAPKNIENQETKDWLIYFQKAHLMTEKEVQETIKTPAVLLAFAASKYDALPSEVRVQYEQEDENYDRVSEYTKSREEKAEARGEAREREKAEIEKLRMIRQLIKENVPISIIASVSGLSESELKALILSG